jgi:hypothetical protein
VLDQRASREGWGLYFKEKVWDLPILLVHLASVISAIAVTCGWVWRAKVEEKFNVSNLFPGAFVLGLLQAIATLMQKWAESNLD